jgi:hypothetical protein
VITGVGLAAGAALGVAAPALGASQSFFVGTTADTNAAPPGDCTSSTNTDCTLRQAITLANANAGQYDYIYFRSDLSGTIALTTAAGGQIPITDATYIYGPGPDQMTVNAAPSSRIFDVNPATPGDRVEIAGLRLSGGNVIGKGGAIQNDDAVLRLFDAILSGNTASVVGGAIYETGNYDSGQDDVISYSTFSDNHAGISGGAIFAESRWGALRSTTFAANSADGGYGGAVSGVSGTIFDSTISGNHASGKGGGVSVSSSSIGLYGAILANNTADTGDPDLNAVGGSAAYDLVENAGASGIGTVPTVITGQDPQLGALQNNGGNTPTLKPAASSPVVDQSVSYGYYDQRGSPRLADNPNKANAGTGPYAGADIGAVELTIAEGPQAGPTAPAPPPAAHKKKCKKKKHKSSAQAAKKCKKKKRSAASRRGFRFAYPSRPPRWAGAEQNPFRLP